MPRRAISGQQKRSEESILSLDGMRIKRKRGFTRFKNEPRSQKKFYSRVGKKRRGKVTVSTQQRMKLGTITKPRPWGLAEQLSGWQRGA